MALRPSGPGASSPLKTTEPPVCTCIRRLSPLGINRLIVLDPFCQNPLHKKAADYGIEPYYQ